MKFDSSWRDEPDQKANIRVAYDGAAPIEVLRWESVPTGPNFHDDAPNETVTVSLKNPAGARSMVITFGYMDAGNNWWWAIDNLEVSEGSAPTPGDVTITGVSKSGANLVINIAGTGNFQLQKKSSLSDTTWTDVGAASATGPFTVPADGRAGFFRIKKL